MGEAYPDSAAYYLIYNGVLELFYIVEAKPP